MSKAYAAADPKAVAAASAGYDAALTEIVQECGYLPPKQCRELIARNVITETRDGQHDPEALKAAGLAALRQPQAVPLALSFIAKLVTCARQASRAFYQARP